MCTLDVKEKILNKILLSCLIVFLFVAGCSKKIDTVEKIIDEHTTVNNLDIETAQEDISSFLIEENIQPHDDDLSNPVEIKIYKIFDSTFSYQIVKLSRDKFPENAVNYFNSNTDIIVKNIRYENTRLIVDFDQSMIRKYEGSGSTGGLLLSNSILHSFSSFPDVTEMKFLFNGAEDVWGDHFNFEGIFPASSHIWTSARIYESDIIGLWESEDDNRHIFYFMSGYIYKEGGKESEWFKIGKWELKGNMLTLILERGAYEEFDDPIYEYYFISVFNDKLLLNYSDELIHQLVKSDYIQWL